MWPEIDVPPIDSHAGLPTGFMQAIAGLFTWLRHGVSLQKGRKRVVLPFRAALPILTGRRKSWLGFGLSKVGDTGFEPVTSTV